MRFVPNLTSTIIANIQQSDAAVQTALQQVSTGQRVNVPSDDPAASAQLVQLQAQTANIDQYTSNGDSVLAQAQIADSTLTSVVAQLNQAVTLGTEGADGESSVGDTRQNLAQSVQSILQSVVALANTTYQGISIFGGTANGQAAFTPSSTSSTGYQYNGNSGVNEVQIGSSLSVQANIPGDTVFTNPNASVLGALSSLQKALTSGTSTDIGNATTAVTTALNYVSQQHVVYGNTINQINAQETYLAQDKITISSNENSLVGIDTATAAEELTQAETDNTATLSASAKVLQNNLLTYLPNS
jgi:flagellar hook-associated protein 3 FlgL